MYGKSIWKIIESQVGKYRIIKQNAREKRFYDAGTAKYCFIDDRSNERRLSWYRRRIHMRKLSELQQEIESVRFELDQALLRQDKFDNYYQKSTKLDQLIEEYIEETERSK